MSGYVMVMQLMPIEIVAVISVLSSAVFWFEWRCESVVQAWVRELLK
jgi:hypothetical protein